MKKLSRPHGQNRTTGHSLKFLQVDIFELWDLINLMDPLRMNNCDDGAAHCRVKGWLISLIVFSNTK